MTVSPTLRSSVWCALLGLGLIGAARPATAADADTFTSSHCGEQPAKPSFDLHDRASYNHSIELLTQYETHAKAWDACMRKEANGAESAISVDAKTKISTIQRSLVAQETQLYGGISGYNDSFKAAAAKLSTKQ